MSNQEIHVFGNFPLKHYALAVLQENVQETLQDDIIRVLAELFPRLLPLFPSASVTSTTDYSTHGTRLRQKYVSSSTGQVLVRFGVQDIDVGILQSLFESAGSDVVSKLSNKRYSIFY
jgi:hypothetical protein